MKNYRVFLARYPNIPEIRSNLGAALAGLGHYSDAAAQYQIALKLKPDPMVRLNLALTYYKSGDLKLAVESLERVRAETPGNIQATTVLADCYLRQGKNREVIYLLTPLDKASTPSPAFDYMLGSALIRDGQLDQGRVVIDRILKNGDSAETQFLMGVTKYVAGDFSAALADFQKAVDAKPNLPDLYSYYGLALLTTGDQAGARKAFERELSANPQDFEANLPLGVLARQDNRSQDALKYLNAALRIRPSDPGVRYQIAVVELSSNNVPEARRYLESLTKDHPEFLEAHISLATVYYREGNKSLGDRERAIVTKLTVARQAKNEVAGKASQ